MKKIVLVNVITIVVLVAIGLVGFHYYSELLTVNFWLYWKSIRSATET